MRQMTRLTVMYSSKGRIYTAAVNAIHKLLAQKRFYGLNNNSDFDLQNKELELISALVDVFSSNDKNLEDAGVEDMLKARICDRISEYRATKRAYLKDLFEDDYDRIILDKKEVV